MIKKKTIYIYKNILSRDNRQVYFSLKNIFFILFWIWICPMVQQNNSESTSVYRKSREQKHVSISDTPCY